MGRVLRVRQRGHVQLICRMVFMTVDILVGAREERVNPG
jgi:hypothetical protein